MLAAACAARTPEERAARETQIRRRETAKLYVRRGRDAEREGDLAAAAEWWRQALLIDPRGDGERRIRRSADRIARFGDRAVEEKRFEDAFLCYGAILRVEPHLPDVIRKNDAAHAAFGEELHAKSVALEGRGLEGAAFVTELRVLHHAPLHPEAFLNATRLKRELLTRNYVSVRGVEMKDAGYWGLGEALVPRLTGRLREDPPLGPTRAKPWIAGRLRVKIESFAWWDEMRFGIERKEMEPGALAIVERPVEEVEDPGFAVDGDDAARDLIANPEHEARAYLVEETEIELERLQTLLRTIGVDAAPREEELAPAATPAPRRHGDPDPEPDPERTPIPPRPPSPETVERLEAELDERRIAVGRVPTTIDRGRAEAKWILPWREATRVVEATVRFELHEIAAPEPDVLVRTLRVTDVDRSHPGSLTHDLEPDPLELAPVAELEERLADELVAQVDVLGRARERRAARVLVRGRAAIAAGDFDAALDAFVDVLFLLGPDKLPGDAAAVIAYRVEHDRFYSILAGPP